MQQDIKAKMFPFPVWKVAGSGEIGVGPKKWGHTPVSITAHLIRYMIRGAEDELQKNVKKAVITVPGNC